MAFPMPPANPPAPQSLIYVDESGNKLIDFGKGVVPFKAVPVLPGSLWLDSIQCKPFTALHYNDAMGLMDRCALYMAQSPTGRKALQILADNQVSFAYEKGSATRSVPGVIAPAGYDIRAKRITFDPNYGTDLLHLLFIQQAGRVDACNTLEIDDITSLNVRSAATAQRAINAYALAGVARHVNECLIVQQDDPQRFVPPALVQTVSELLPTLALASQVPIELTPLSFMQTVFYIYAKDTQDIAVHDKLLLDQYRAHIPHADRVGTQDAEADFISKYLKFLSRELDPDYISARLFKSDPAQVRETGLNLEAPEYTHLVREPMVEEAFRLLRRAIDEEPSIELGKIRTKRDLKAILASAGSVVFQEKLEFFGPN